MVKPNFILALLLIMGCGSSEDSTPGTCGATFVDSGMQLSVKPLGSNTYLMELCAPVKPAAVFTVYGAPQSTDLDPTNINMAASWRLQSVQGVSKTGDKFQVQFHSFDRYFAIYKDKDLGGGVYQKDTGQALMSPHALPSQ
ncbi:MAG: hypothetical protein IT289_01530 [Oligoflexia bacterium]|nr:hypothetical protein [Oligoflexia bacterium]